jgi:hypothetical protein
MDQALERQATAGIHPKTEAYPVLTEYRLMTIMIP